MDMAVVMDGAIAADAGIITGGAEVVATTMVGGIIAITGDLNLISSKRPLSRRPLSRPVATYVCAWPLGETRTDDQRGPELTVANDSNRRGPYRKPKNERIMPTTTTRPTI